ncbi:hypothetical protein OG948_13475 [Embleya sp. NBC_00888]|uniref:hypothetical protein n=1 Tax=Embleya sp. NBC_00888 TaxID=2975960 RepID=UPI003866CD55|nr:hypothetical protein OG948_13475 [Embleya sp. NBC_00888]
MSLLTDRLPTVDRSITGRTPGPLASQPFGLDFVTRPVTIADQPLTITVDPQSRLSLADDLVVIDTPILTPIMGSCCNTESDGQTVISVDTDENDD